MLKTKEITLIAILTTILFVQEQLLSFIPNIQLTFLLIVIYSKVLGLSKTLIIIVLHVILDTLINGSFTPLIIVPMLIGYSMVPITLQVLFKNAKIPLFLALFGIVFACLYSISFMIINVLILDIKLLTYIVADIPFTIILAMSNFLTILWLYEPLSKLLIRIIQKDN